MIGLVSLAFIVAGVATSLISGDPRFILIKESLLTAFFGGAAESELRDRAAAWATGELRRLVRPAALDRVLARLYPRR